MFGMGRGYTSHVLLISPRFVYLIASLCGLYGSAMPFLSSTHSPVSFFRVCVGVGTVLLLIAAVFPSRNKPSSVDLTIRDSYRVISASAVFALLGSTVTTVLLLYGVARFVAFRLGYVRGTLRLGAYHPNAFDRVNQMLTKPILLLFLLSSVASLVISALITRRSQDRTSIAGTPR